MVQVKREISFRAMQYGCSCNLINKQPGDILQLMTVGHAYSNFATVTPYIPQKWTREKNARPESLCRITS